MLTKGEMTVKWNILAKNWHFQLHFNYISYIIWSIFNKLSSGNVKKLGASIFFLLLEIKSYEAPIISAYHPPMTMLLTIDWLRDANSWGYERSNTDNQPNQSQNDTLILVCDISQALDATENQCYKQIYCSGCGTIDRVVAFNIGFNYT